MDWSLYAIIDHDFIENRSLQKITEELIAGGVGLIQVRNKLSNMKVFYEEAVQVATIAKYHEIPVIINDRLDIAMAVDADGIHVGQEDLPVSVIRKVWRRDKIIGVSVHSVEEFGRVAGEEPDYFGVGTIYATNTKSGLRSTGPAIISELRGKTGKPLIAIGGINLNNIKPVFAAGANGVAVISALLKTADAEQAAHDFRSKIDLLLSEKA